jgi:hypothetical protein
VSDVLWAVIVMLADEQISCCIENSPDVSDELIVYAFVGIGRTVIVPSL